MAPEEGPSEVAAPLLVYSPVHKADFPVNIELDERIGPIQRFQLPIRGGHERTSLGAHVSHLVAHLPIESWNFYLKRKDQPRIRVNSQRSIHSFELPVPDDEQSTYFEIELEPNKFKLMIKQVCIFMFQTLSFFFSLTQHSTLLGRQVTNAIASLRC